MKLTDIGSTIGIVVGLYLPIYLGWSWLLCPVFAIVGFLYLAWLERLLQAEKRFVDR